MKVLVFILIGIVFIVLVWIILAALKRRGDALANYYVNNYGQGNLKTRYHHVDLSDEDLEWLIWYYNDEVKTRYHKVAGGTLVERGSQFQLQILRDLRNRQLTDEQIDEIDMKLFLTMRSIQRYSQERYQQMDEMRKKLKRIKETM